jgi:hypothetical protein
LAEILNLVSECEVSLGRSGFDGDPVDLKIAGIENQRIRSRFVIDSQRGGAGDLLLVEVNCDVQVEVFHHDRSDISERVRITVRL